MDSLVYSILLLFLTCLLIWFFVGPYRQYQIDNIRNTLFTYRNILHDCAANGELSFDSQAYIETRKILNSFLRYAHDITFSLAVTTLAYSYIKKDYNRTSPLSRVIEECTPKEQARIFIILGLAGFQLLLFILRTSLIFGVLFLIYENIRKLLLKLFHRDDSSHPHINSKLRHQIGKSTSWAQAGLDKVIEGTI